MSSDGKFDKRGTGRRIDALGKPIVSIVEQQKFALVPPPHPDVEPNTPSLEPAESLEAELTRVGEHLPKLKPYNPKLIGRGGNSAVFEVTGHPEVIVKVDYKQLVWIARNRPRLIKQKIDPRELEELKDYASREQSRFNQYSGYFEKDAVLKTRFTIGTVPFTPRLFEFISRAPMPPLDLKVSTPILVTASVQVQEKLPAEANGSDSYSFTSGYLERDPHLTEAELRAIDRVLFDEKNPNEDEAMNYFMAIDRRDGEPKWREIVSSMIIDSQLNKVVKDFVERVLKYVHETGEMPDFAGSDNFVLFQQNHRWKIVAVDPLAGERVLLGLEKALFNIANRSTEQDDDNRIMNGLCGARFINALAIICHSDGRIRFDQPISAFTHQIITMGRRILKVQVDPVLGLAETVPKPRDD